MTTQTQIVTKWLGRVGYEDGYRLQVETHTKRVNGEIPDTLLLMEHDHVYTLGRRGTNADVLLEPRRRREMGIKVIETDRGGQATYHGPGQLVAYPVINLKERGIGPRRYVCLLEEVIIAVLAEYNITGRRLEGNPGIYVAKQESPQGVAKIAAIGVRLSKNVTMHGFSLNLDCDTAFYKHIVPCGMRGLPATSVKDESGRDVDFNAVRAKVAALIEHALPA